MATNQAVTSGGAPVTMGPVGFWLDQNGNVAATDPSGQPQVTPGMRDNPQAQVYYDPDKDLFYNEVNGNKVYQSPYGTQLGAQGSGHGMTPQSGGYLHTRGEWNPLTGEFEQGLNWSNLLSTAVGLGIGAGALSAAGAVEGGAGAGADVGADTASATLPSTAIGTGAVGPVGLAPSGVTAGVDAGATTAGAGVLPSTQIGTGEIPPVGGAPSGVVPGSGGNVLSQFGDALKSPNALSSIGKMVSAATTASQANQRGDANITQNAFVEDATLEAQQRQQALKDIFKQGLVAGGSHSPYDKTPPAISDAYRAALLNLQQQGSQKLAGAPKYSTDNFPSPQSYTASTPGQTAGTYIGPALQILGQIPWGSL